MPPPTLKRKHAAASEPLQRSGPGIKQAEAAACRVQKWFRLLVRNHMLTPQLVEEFIRSGPKAFVAVQHGPAEAVVPSLSFDDLVAFLRRPGTTRLMTHTVLRVFYLCYGKRNTRCIAEANLNIRVFFAAYMIHFRARFVFENMGQLETRLVALSGALLQQFERVSLELAGKPIQNIDNTITKDFPDTLQEYVLAFKAWKIRDEVKHANRLKHCLGALYATEAQVDRHDPRTLQLRAGVRAKIEQVSRKLVLVAGEAALRSYESANNLPHLAVQGVDKSGAPAAVCTAKENFTEGLFPDRLSNERLAHELMMDPRFALRDGGGSCAESPVFETMRASFHAAFWASLVDDLSLNPPSYVRVVRVLGEIRDGINELAAGTALHDAIAKVIDMDAIREATRVAMDKISALPWQDCVQLVTGTVAILKRMQAPKRDAETLQKWVPVSLTMQQANEIVQLQPKAFCGGLEFVLNRVNVIRIDCANTRLRGIASVIGAMGAEYERAHLERKILAGRIPGDLPRTATLIATTIQTEVSAGRVDVHDLRSGSATAFAYVQRAAILALGTCSETPLTCETAPEVRWHTFALGCLLVCFQAGCPSVD
jgi:hypothetical protein